MNVSQKTQKIIAATLGVALLVVIGVTLTRNYILDDTTSGTDTEVAAQTEEANAEGEAESTENADELADTVGEEVAEPAEEPAPEEAEEAPAPEEPAETEETPAPEETEEAEEPESTEEAPATAPETTDTTKDYTYTAAPGDSYTALAITSVADYASSNKLNLSDAQINATAATLAANAGSPFLDINQAVTISQSDIAALVTTSTADAEATASAPTTPYSYVAATGDSYSTLTRTAVAAYIADAKIDLNANQRIAAETFIISDLGFPELEIGQTVTLTANSLKTAATTAQNLSATAQASWAPFAALAGL